MKLDEGIGLFELSSLFIFGLT